MIEPEGKEFDRPHNGPFKRSRSQIEMKESNEEKEEGIAREEGKGERKREVSRHAGIAKQTCTQTDWPKDRRTDSQTNGQPR